MTYFRLTLFTGLKFYWICLHCLHLSKKRKRPLIFSWLKKSCFLKSTLLPNFAFDDLYTGNKKNIIKKIFRWCLIRYYSMISSRCYYLVSKIIEGGQKRVPQMGLHITIYKQFEFFVKMSLVCKNIFSIFLFFLCWTTQRWALQLNLNYVLSQSNTVFSTSTVFMWSFFHQNPAFLKI